MKKLTQTINAGNTVVFPSCKSFVFLRSEYPVSFKFITMYNKIDRTINEFQDSFSVTANTYFLRVEIKSMETQEVSCILIEDTAISYTPITGDVYISNDLNHRIPTQSYITNSSNYPAPVYSPKGMQTNHKIDSQKFYKSNYSERFKSGCFIESQQAASDLECYSIFPSIDYSYGFAGQHAFITEIWVTPETDNFLEFWYVNSNARSWYDYNTSLGWMKSLDGYVSNYFGGHLELHDIRYKNETRINLLNAPYQYLLFSFPIKANETYHQKFDYPLLIPLRSSKVYGNYSCLTITTKTNCHFNTNLILEAFENKYFDNTIYPQPVF